MESLEDPHDHGFASIGQGFALDKLSIAELMEIGDEVSAINEKQSTAISFITRSIGTLTRFLTAGFTGKASTVRAKQARAKAREEQAFRLHNERLEVAGRMKGHSKMLFKVIEEAMSNAGYLSATYSYKVMAQDTSGKRFTIMLVVPNMIFTNTTTLLRAERAIKESAKHRLAITVRVVYWSCRTEPHLHAVNDLSDGIEVSNDEPASDADIQAFKRQLELGSSKPHLVANDVWQDTDSLGMPLARRASG